MIFIFLIAVMIIMGGAGAQLGELESCDLSELKLCVEKIPRTRVGLPRNKAELDAHCQAYQIGMSCMDVWIKRCLPTDGQKFLQKQIAGARALMRFICNNETALRREFLKGSTCWAMVSAEWSQCVDELQIAVRDITEHSQHLVYINKNSELCCAREAFLTCVSYSGRVCSNNASTLLQRIAWVLAQDVAVCNEEALAHCAAPLTSLTASLLAILVVIHLFGNFFKNLSIIISNT